MRTDRHLSDEMLRHITACGGMSGVVLHNSFSQAGRAHGQTLVPPVTLAYLGGGADFVPLEHQSSVRAGNWTRWLARPRI